MLELGPDLPEDDAEIERWCGEPLRAVVLPTAVFMTNKKGYPTLSRRQRPPRHPPPPVPPAPPGHPGYRTIANGCGRGGRRAPDTRTNSMPE